MTADYSLVPTGASITLSVPVDCAGMRLDQVLARLMPEHSRTRLQGWVREGRVRMGVPATDPKLKLWGGERLEVLPPVAACECDAAQDIPLTILYEDDALLVIDKPAGLVVHPGAGNADSTLMNALLHHRPALRDVARAGIVHRLDKDTSGLLVVAGTPKAHTSLVRQLQARTVKREYFALVWGDIAVGGTVEGAIGRHPQHRTRMAVIAGGRPARTHYRVLERFGRITALECSLETGRTHQIRVHLTHLGHPLLGDPVYGRRAAVPAGVTLDRQALHARRLALVHPQSGQTMTWESALAPDLQVFLAKLKGGSDA